MTLTNKKYWQEFCEWATSRGKDEVLKIMAAYIVKNLKHFMQFVKNYRILHDEKT